VFGEGRDAHAYAFLVQFAKLGFVLTGMNMKLESFWGNRGFGSLFVFSGQISALFSRSARIEYQPHRKNKRNHKRDTLKKWRWR
jgi:hypothetical protein